MTSAPDDKTSTCFSLCSGALKPRNPLTKFARTAKRSPEVRGNSENAGVHQELCKQEVVGESCGRYAVLARASRPIPIGSIPPDPLSERSLTPVAWCTTRFEGLEQVQ